MSAIEMVSVNGARLAARVDGDPAKPWLILSNSLACSLESWRLQMPLLTKTHRVLCYDTRAHGQSNAPAGPYRMSTLEDDVIGLMDHFGIGRADFLGLSLGGMAALGVAISHPERVKSLVATASRSDSNPAFVDNWNTRIGLVRGAGGMEGIVDFTIQRWFMPAFRETHPEIVKEASDMIRACDMEGYIACAEALKGLDYKRHLGSISVPVLLIAGEKDPGAPPAELSDMASRIPGARFVEIAAAHIIPMENPEAFNAVIGPWLAAQSAVTEVRP